MRAQTLRIHPGDNVAVALTTLPRGQEFSSGCIAEEVIPTKHKVCTQSIARGEHVLMYGVPVGVATCDLKNRGLNGMFDRLTCPGGLGLHHPPHHFLRGLVLHETMHLLRQGKLHLLLVVHRLRSMIA